MTGPFFHASLPAESDMGFLPFLTFVVCHNIFVVKVVFGMATVGVVVVSFVCLFFVLDVSVAFFFHAILAISVF